MDSVSTCPSIQNVDIDPEGRFKYVLINSKISQPRNFDILSYEGIAGPRFMQQ